MSGSVAPSAATGPAPAIAIPLHGPLFEGVAVGAGWPVEAEFDRITSLRNRTTVRGRFLDPRPLDLEANRAWLAHGMSRPREAVLAIRLASNGAFVGAIGWSGYDPVAGTMELGRVMVDARAVVPYRCALPPGYPGVAADAGIALRDFAFGRMGIRTMTSVVIGDNALSKRAVLFGGARVVGTASAARTDGSVVSLLKLEMTRDEWLAIVAGAPSQRA